MPIMAFGKDMSGKLLFKPMEEQHFFNSLKAALAGNYRVFRAEKILPSRGIFSRKARLRPVIDAADPKQAGWTYIISQKDPKIPEIKEILKPLATYRGMLNPDKPLLYDNPASDTWKDWLEKQYYSDESLENIDIPKYIVIVGNPEMIPLQFQSFLSSSSNVGRLDFDILEQLDTYVKKVLRLETTSKLMLQKEAVMFATDEGENDPTHYSRVYMAEPLADHITKTIGFNTGTLIGENATKEKLLETLATSKAALVYTVSHGLGSPNKSLDFQRRFNGAICCQSNGALTFNDLFSADDIPMTQPFLEGAAFFQFACYGYGTPALSDYSHWLDNFPGKNTEADFIAALPKRLLSHPRGPVMYIGHLDTAFLAGFTSEQNPDTVKRWYPRIRPYLNAIHGLLTVQPSGLAMQDMNQRVNKCNAELTNIYDKDKKGMYEWTSVTQKNFVDTWILRNDAQNFMILGDPAAILTISE